MTQADWGTMEWLADGKADPGLGLSLARMIVQPGKTSPAHRHPNCNEVIHVLSGEMDERLNDTWVRCQTGDTISAKAGIIHQTRCVGDAPVVMMIAYSDDTRIYEEVNA